MAERLPLRHPRRQATLVAFALVASCAWGCAADRRGPRCEAFVASADACLTQAGLPLFFAENVDCERPVSTVREYRCLEAAYVRATDNGLCRDRDSAALIVDFTSLSCLGFSGGLSGDDDDSAVDDDDSALR